MARHSKARPSLDQLDPVIPRAELLRDPLCVSHTTAWNRERTRYPNWPEPIALPGGRIGYRLSAVKRWLNSLEPTDSGCKPTAALSSRGLKCRGVL